MATPTSPGNVRSVAVTGNADIDALLWLTAWAGSPTATTQITYSFPGVSAYWSTSSIDGYGPTYGSGEPWSYYGGALLASQQTAVRAALQEWSNIAKINFVEVADNAVTVGDIRFASTGNADPNEDAHAYLPYSGASAGDVWLNYFGETAQDLNITPGEFSYLTLVHEIGHALGLKHPFSTVGSGVVLQSADDCLFNTVMSYTTHPSYPDAIPSIYPTSPMSYDIAAIQYLYGANLSYHAGNDVYTFNQGSAYFETIWDGGGIDTIVWTGASQGVEIDLRPGAWSSLGNPIQFMDPYWGYTVGTVIWTVNIYQSVTIEHATGGGGSDNLIGNDVNNVLQGGGGNDSLDGGAGADTLVGGTGTDAMVGGAGNDTFDVDSVSDVVSELAGGGTDLVQSSVSYVLPINLEDLTLTGTGAINGTGNTVDNTLTGNPGNNRLDGGAGVDTVSYWNALAGVNVSLAIPGAQATGGAGTDTLVNIENLTGSNFADRLTGNTGNNVIIGGLGNDTLDGGAGVDVLSYASAASGVTVNLALTTGQNTIGAGTDTLTNFEHLIGSNYADVLTGNAANNIIVGGLGNDRLDGGAGKDTASYATASVGVTANLGLATAQNTGGAGTDTLVNIENLTGSNYNDVLTGNAGTNVLLGGLGNDVLNGAAGSDTASYVDAAKAVTVSLAVLTAQNTVGAGIDTLLGIENLTGSNLADRLTGNTGDNLIVGGPGNDTLDGGAGVDTVSYATATVGVSVNLGVTAAQNTVGGGVDTVVNFENLTGSILADTLIGSSAGNVLTGLGGSDILRGGAGNDVLIYDAVDAEVNGGLGTDCLRLDVTGTLTLGGLAGVKLVDVEQISLSGASGAAVTLNLTVQDVLNLSSTGNNLLVMGGAEDTVNAGAGWTQGTNQTFGGQVYATYTQAGATLLADLDITRHITA